MNNYGAVVVAIKWAGALWAMAMGVVAWHWFFWPLCALRVWMYPESMCPPALGGLHLMDWVVLVIGNAGFWTVVSTSPMLTIVGLRTAPHD